MVGGMEGAAALSGGARLCGRLAWQLDGEGRALSPDGMDAHLASVRACEVLDDVEAVPRPAYLARGRDVNAVEALEDARQVFRGYALTGVRHADEVARSLFVPDVYRAAAPAELDRVVHEVD